MYIYKKEVITTITFSDEEIEKIKADLAENWDMKIEEIKDNDVLESLDDIFPEDICITYDIPWDNLDCNINSDFKKER